MAQLDRREFLHLLAVASAGGFALNAGNNFAVSHVDKPAAIYDLPRKGNVHLLHMTDCHAQLKPIYFREPNVNLGVGLALGKAPHLVGEKLLKAFNLKASSREAHAFTHLNFENAAVTYGKVGGFAHLATLVKQLKAARPGALLLDGGDTWQGSATALWTKGQDMVDAALLLGVDIMTAHWEFTLGDKRLLEIVNKDFKGKIEFLAQNIRTTDFEDAVFPGYTIRQMNGVAVAIIGQAFPYTPIANPRYFTPEWTFGIREEALQKVVEDVRKQGVSVVVLLSHNGMDVDLKLASRVTGIDVILGGHTHDGVPAPIKVANPQGYTLVTNAGSNGKFLGVLDIDVQNKKIVDIHYRLLPVFSNLLPADSAMDKLVTGIRAPYEAKLGEKLATTQGTLYRRGSFNGSFDQLILNSLLEVKDAQIAFSPGFRWGTSLLPGQAITREHVMDQTAITYPFTTLNDMTGATIKTVLEDIADNLFNPDPYLQQGGDMVRVGGLQYSCEPNARAGSRISDMQLNGKQIDADKTYKVSGWAPVSEAGRDANGEPVWDVVERYVKDKGIIAPVKLNLPKLIGVAGNPGMAI